MRAAGERRRRATTVLRGRRAAPSARLDLAGDRAEVVDVGGARAGQLHDLDVDVLRAAAGAHVEPQRLACRRPARTRKRWIDRDVGLQRVVPAGEAVGPVGGVGVDDLELRGVGRLGAAFAVSSVVRSSPHQVVGRPSGAAAVAAACAVETTSARSTLLSAGSARVGVRRRHVAAAGVGSDEASAAASRRRGAKPGGSRWRLQGGSSSPGRSTQGRRLQAALDQVPAGSMPQRPASADSSALIGQRSGSGSPSKSGAAPLSDHRAGVVADRADLGDLVGAQARSAADGGELGALVLDRPRARAELLDQRRRDAGDRLVGEVPVAGELQHRQAVALGDRAHPLEPLAARARPSRPAGTPRWS